MTLWILLVVTCALLVSRVMFPAKRRAFGHGLLNNILFVGIYILMFPAHWLDKHRANKYKAAKVPEYTPEAPMLPPAIVIHLSLGDGLQDRDPPDVWGKDMEAFRVSVERSIVKEWN